MHPHDILGIILIVFIIGYGAGLIRSIKKED